MIQAGMTPTIIPTDSFSEVVNLLVIDSNLVYPKLRSTHASCYTVLKEVVVLNKTLEGELLLQWIWITYMGVYLPIQNFEVCFRLRSGQT